MMTKKLVIQKLSTNIFIVAGICCGFFACTDPALKDLESGRRLLEKKDPKAALPYFERAIARDPLTPVALEAAHEAARLSVVEIKNFEKAVEFYRRIVLSSSDHHERTEAQKKIISIYSENLNDYARAITEIQKLLPQLKEPKELIRYKSDLAKAYFYLNNFSQAENEINEFLKQNIDPRQEFQMSILLANVLMAQKRLNPAVELIKKLIVAHPKEAKEENLGVTLAVIYEELQDYKAAVGILKAIRDTHSNPEYIDIRIKRLQARSINQPGARGFRK